MRRGKAVLALGVLAGAAALGLGGSMAAKRQPLPLPARYDLREDGAGPWIRDQGDQNTCWAFASVTALETSMKEEERIPLSADHMIHKNLSLIHILKDDISVDIQGYDIDGEIVRAARANAAAAGVDHLIHFQQRPVSQLSHPKKMCIRDSAIQGMGFSTFAILAGVCEMVARAFVGFCLVPVFGFLPACFASPLAWICADLFLVPAFGQCLKKLKRTFGE